MSDKSSTNQGFKGNGSGAGEKKLGFGDYFFLDILMRENDRENFKGWVMTAEDPLEYLNVLLAGGCKVSFTLDARGGGVICSASQRDPNNPDAGAILTGRHRDAALALLTLQYKDEVIVAERTWCEARSYRGSPGEEQG